jgi:hypothetical protein
VPRLGDASQRRFLAQLPAFAAGGH